MKKKSLIFLTIIEIIIVIMVIGVSLLIVAAGACLVVKQVKEN